MDGSQRLIGWNSRYEEIMGYPPGLLSVGKPVTDLMRYNAARGRYRHLLLPSRFGESVPPLIEAIDLRADPPERGHWLSPKLHDAVAEAAVVGYPHDIKGQGIYAYVTLMTGVEANDELRKELVKHVRSEIGPIASPDVIQWAPGLPKTRSGKIMRRILRKIAANEIENLGDTSTLADPSVVDNLIDNRAVK